MFSVKHSGLTGGLKALGHVCAACEGRQPLHALQGCARNVGEQETASFLPGLLQTRGPEPPLVTVVSHICSPLLGRERDMNESLWLWSLVVEGLCLTFLWAAGTPHLLLILQGLQSQLKVRRKRVPIHYGALCPGGSLHPPFATMQGLQQPTGRTTPRCCFRSVLSTRLSFSTPRTLVPGRAVRTKC